MRFPLHQGDRRLALDMGVRVACALLGVGLAGPKAGAATFVVDSADDTVAVAPASSPKDANGNVTLRSAIMAANAQTGADTVVLAAGAIYILKRGPSDSAFGDLDAARGDLDITDDLTLLGNGATVDAGRVDRAFAIERPDLKDFTVSIERLNVRGGAPKGHLSPGGGISLRAATLDLTDCVLSGNTTIEAGSSDNGGGIAANGVRYPAESPARLTLRGCTVSKNSANNGGGILAADCLLTLTDCRIQDNQAVGTDAGTGGGNLFLTGSATQAAISNSLIAGGVGSADGGGLTVFSAGLRIEDSTVSSNTAERNGGGLFDSPVSPGTVGAQRTTFDGNRADRNADGIGNGGGLFTSGYAELVNTTVSGNTAAGGGGYAGSGRTDLVNVTVANNSANEGGGLLPSGMTAMLNTLVADNSASVGPDARGMLVTAGYNLIGNRIEVVLVGIVTGNQLNVSANIGPLADNGGPTRTHALLGGSPAIDGASPSSFPFSDQRGKFRPQDGDGNGGVLADIGAFELVPPYVVAEAAHALRIAGGLLPASFLDVGRLDIGNRNESIDIGDAIRLARKAAGLDPNP